jgi:hypothetical protein
MFKRMLRRVSVLVLIATGMAACSPKPSAQHPLVVQNSSFDWQAIFSTRPTPDSHAFFLVKLKSAPLFTSLKKENGVLSANPDLVKSLAAEQDLVLKELARLNF